MKSLTMALGLMALAGLVEVQGQIPGPNDDLVELSLAIGENRNITGRVATNRPIRVRLEAQNLAFAITPRVLDGKVEVTVRRLDPASVETAEPGPVLEQAMLAVGEGKMFASIPRSYIVIEGIFEGAGTGAFQFTSLAPVMPCCVTCGNVTTCACGVKDDCDSCCDVPSCCKQTQVMFRSAFLGEERSCSVGRNNVHQVKALED